MGVSLFELGQIVVTRRAFHTLHPEDVILALDRYLSGDWGELCEEDRQQNVLALQEGHRLFAVYSDRNRTKFHCITEHDRSVTTILLPEDY